MKKKNISTATNIAGVRFDSCVFNASGVKDTTYEELEMLSKYSGATVMKSATLKERGANSEPWFHLIGKHDMTQSNGLHNHGHKTYITYSFALKEKYPGKKIIASSAGFSIKENVTMVKAFQKSAVDIVIVNCGCPNIEGKPILGYDFKQMKKLLRALKDIGPKPIGLKLPPYFDPAHWDTLSELILPSDISVLVCVNSLGNVLVIDPMTRRTVTRPKNGYAGLSGDKIGEVANANIHAFYTRLGNKVSIIGGGGIRDKLSAFERILAGADALEVGTALYRGNYKILSKIDCGVSEMLEYHGFNSIQEAKGQLLYI